MNVLSDVSQAQIGTVRDRTYTRFLWRTITTVRVPGKADDVGLSSGSDIYLRIALLDFSKNHDLALKYKDETRVMFRASLKPGSTPLIRDILEHPTTGVQYEVIGAEESPTEDKTASYLVIAEVIE